MYKLGRGEVIVEKLKRLTEMTTSGGWAAKIGPEVLASVLSQLPKNENNNNLLVGLDTKWWNSINSNFRLFYSNDRWSLYIWADSSC